MRRPRGDWRRVDGLWTYAAVAGAGEPVVLVPGLGCSHLYFRRLQEELARSHEVWAFDPPGHGNTKAGPGAYLSLASLTDHLAAWLTAVGLRGACVLGHSQGGELAIDLAARHPGLPGRLVLCAPTGIPENPSVPRQIANLLRDAPLERPAFVASAVASYARCGPSRMWRLAADQRRHLTGPLLPRVGVPVLLLAGGRDPVIRPSTFEALRTAIPHAEALEIPEGTHALHDRCAGEVAAAVAAFLGGLDPGHSGP